MVPGISFRLQCASCDCIQMTCHCLVKLVYVLHMLTHCMRVMLHMHTHANKTFHIEAHAHQNKKTSVWFTCKRVIIWFFHSRYANSLCVARKYK